MKVDSTGLRAAREHAGLTRRELGRLSGVSKETIKRLENGRGGALHETLEALARALGKTVADFRADEVTA